MKLPAHVIEMVTSYKGMIPVAFTDSWESRSDDNGHNHCSCCARDIVVGDRCLVRYYERTSFVFCLDCFHDNVGVMSAWLERP